MDPSGAGRARGFRAPRTEERPDPVPHADQIQTQVESQVESQVDQGETQVETLASGPPPRTRRFSRPFNRRLDRRLLPLGAALVALVLVATVAFLLGSRLTPAADQSAPSPTPTPKASATPLPVPALFSLVAPSVVLVTTSKGALGSGTIVTDTGTVLTAYHVVAGGGTVSLVFADGTKSTAKIASTSPKTDTATLTPQRLPEVVVPATLGGGVTVGSDVVAVGNPLGLRASASTGIVSGLNRKSQSRTGTLSGLIQFDAAVNPGSSGGPLLNDQGSVVGVVVSIADPGGDEAFAGIGFAVPLGAALGGTGDGPGPGGPRL